MSTLTVRLARPEEAQKIAEFNRAMARETQAKDLEPGVILSGVERLMARPELGFYLVAEEEGALVGCAVITTEWTDWRDGLFWWLKSVYVVPAARRQGVNREIYQFVSDLAKGNPEVRAIRVYIAESNRSATVAYQALGLKELPRRCFHGDL